MCVWISKTMQLHGCKLEYTYSVCSSSSFAIGWECASYCIPRSTQTPALGWEPVREFSLGPLQKKMKITSVEKHFPAVEFQRHHRVGGNRPSKGSGALVEFPELSSWKSSFGPIADLQAKTIPGASEPDQSVHTLKTQRLSDPVSLDKYQIGSDGSLQECKRHLPLARFRDAQKGTQWRYHEKRPSSCHC